MKRTKKYNLMQELWPYNRSITGNGVRQSLDIIQKKINDFKIIEVSSATKYSDWTIPKEWNVSDAYVKLTLMEK